MNLGPLRQFPQLIQGQLISNLTGWDPIIFPMSPTAKERSLCARVWRSPQPSERPPPHTHSPDTDGFCVSRANIVFNDLITHNAC